jgi:colanic acid/amylovoran biosynthesis glycosyltransferase
MMASKNQISNYNLLKERKVIFITTTTPFSENAEIFVLDELANYREISTAFWLLPARRRELTIAPLAIESGLINHVINPALISFSTIFSAFQILFKRPSAVLYQIYEIMCHSGGLRNLINNLLTFPKALWLAGFIRSNEVEHIHAYWLTHTATMAMVAAKLAKVSWSGTGYRWDIDSKNLMQAKFSTAAFLRCADELGSFDLSRLNKIYGTNTKLAMVRTGVYLPSRDSWSHKPVNNKRFVCAGAFVPKKQQELLVRAFARHLQMFPDARLELVGDGPLRQRVAIIVKELGIEFSVRFQDTLALEELRALFRERPISVLPSIITDSAEQEGIPVVLIEAMANGSPVISTTTGSISALVLDQCGLLVNPGSVESLVDALCLVAENTQIAEAWADRAYDRLGEEFNGKVSARLLAELIASAG